MKKNLLLLSLVFFTRINSSGQIAGPSPGNSFTTVAIPGSSKTWNDPGNTAASDNSYTTFGTITVKNGYTDYLVITGFGFNIPSGSTISGIVLEIERSDANSMTIDNSIKLVKNGVIEGDEKAVSATYPITDGTQTYGNAGDTWGLAWSVDDINSPNFGVAISARKINATNGAAAGKIDYVQITVYYDFVTLPVNLINFSATKNNRSVTLEWTTANEINMTSYEVQRSEDGINFKTITSVPSYNNLASTDYSYEDVNPSGGVLYYRLIMLGFSGYSKYSKVIMVNPGSENKISLYPNPVSTNQALHLSGRNGSVLNILFFDEAGRLLSSQTFNSDNITLSSLHAQKGIVLYLITDRNAQIVNRGRLIVQ